MKKIVGILGAAVVLATSVFAADLSGKVKMTGDIFSWEQDGKKFSMLKVTENNTANYDALFSLSANTDIAGAKVDLWHNNHTMFRTNYWDGEDNKWYNGWIGESKMHTFTYMSASHWSIWFKPIDMLKVTVGHFATGLNQEHIEWYKLGGVKVDNIGFALSFTKDALYADFYIGGGSWDTPYFSKEGDNDAELGIVYLKAGYAADFGDISAAFKLKDTKKMEFGVGYKNTFAPITFFVNVLGDVNNSKFGNIVIEEDVSGNIDALSFEQFAQVTIPTAEGSKVSALVEAEIRYAINGLTPYLRITDADILADPFAINLKPGVRGNVGAMSYDASVDITITKDESKISVPVIFTVNF